MDSEWYYTSRFKQKFRLDQPWNTNLEAEGGQGLRVILMLGQGIILFEAYWSLRGSGS